MTYHKTLLILTTTLLSTNLIFINVAHARIKLVTLPDRDNTTVRLDNPQATLVEEEYIPMGMNRWRWPKSQQSDIRRHWRKLVTGQSPRTLSQHLNSFMRRTIISSTLQKIHKAIVD